MFSRNLIFLLAGLLLFSSSCHFVKSVLFLRPDHRDHKRFSKNVIKAAENIYYWEYHPKQLDPSNIHLSYKNGEEATLNKLLGNSDTNGFLIIKDGKILYEKYFRNYDSTKTHGSFSVSKGMLSAMLGIAIEDGLIKSLEDPITNYVPELLINDTNFEKITILHLLDMNSGIKVRGKDASLFGDLARTYYGNKFSRFLKTIEIANAPGGDHLYNQSDAQILSLILSRVSNKSLSEYFYEEIWRKIGGNEAIWSTYKRDQLEKGFCCFNARVQDYAKFGQLYLQNGKWNGEQIIPESWVNYTTNKGELKKSKWSFSFHKYWFPSNDGKSDYTAQGYNRQYIYVNPDKNLVILRFGRKEKTDVEWEQTLRSIAEQLKLL